MNAVVWSASAEEALYRNFRMNEWDCFWFLTKCFTLLLLYKVCAYVYGLFSVWVVQSISCSVYGLLRLCCSVYGLFSLCIVQTVCCSVYGLFSLWVVQSMHCSVYALFSLWVVQSMSCLSIRMMIRIFPEKQSELEDAVQEKEPPMESEYPVIPSEALPFSSKKAMYENKPVSSLLHNLELVSFKINNSVLICLK